MSGGSRKAVITGCGALSPFGRGVDVFWQSLLGGQSALRPIRSFDTTGYINAKAAEVSDFVPARDLLPGEAQRLDRITQFALCAAREALHDAGLELARVDDTSVGVILATTLGGMLIGEAYQRSLLTKEDAGALPVLTKEGAAALPLLTKEGAGGRFEPRQLLHFPYYAVANRLARELGVRGPVVSPSMACASGTHAVGLALHYIRRGYADVFVVGGVETICPFVVSGFNSLRATTADTVRPFDGRRTGLLLGEGAAVLVVEDAAHARARGARARVEVAGAGLAGDAVHMTAPARDGAGAARAMRAALAEAHVAPTAIDFISAHGTGTVFNDAMEVAAIAAVFGDGAPRVPVNGIKGAIGHTLGAAGAFEAIMCTRALAEAVIPPTINCEELDPSCPLDIVRGAPRPHQMTSALSTSSAFAGSNAAIVLRKT